MIRALPGLAIRGTCYPFCVVLAAPNLSVFFAKCQRGMITREGGGPVYKGIIATLEKELKPTELNLIDDSSKHAGHAAMRAAEAASGEAVRESHFKLSVVSEKFEGLSRVKRHQLVRHLLSRCFT